MPNRRHDPAPAGLLALATVALVLSWLAATRWTTAPGQQPPAKDYARTTLPAAQPWGELRIPRFQLDLSDLLPPDPALPLPQRLSQPIAPAPSVVVETPALPPLGPGQFLTFPLERHEEGAELLVLLPGQPLWTARSALLPRPWAKVSLQAEADRWRVFGVDLAHAAPLGRMWAGMPAVKVSLPTAANLPWRRAVLPPPPTRIYSPPSLTGPLLSSPDDRLAMNRPADRETPPSAAIRSRSTPLTPAAPLAKVADAEPLGFAAPRALLDLLAELRGDPQSRGWAVAVEPLLDEVVRADASEASLASLREASQEGLALADQVTSRDTAARLRRAHWAIQRRTPAWTLAAQSREQSGVAFLRRAPDETDRRVRQRLEELVEQTRSSDRGAAWREYLLADSLQGALYADPQVRRELAYEVLGRMHSSRLTPDQKRLVTSGPIAALGDDLRDWAAEPIDPAAVLAGLEAYESSPTPRLARQLASERDRLAFSPSPLHQQLATQIDQQYRNANLRIAVAADLLNRYVPEQQPAAEPVRDHIAGAPVSGQATTDTRLSIRLVPDDAAWRMGLEAQGQVRSNTRSHSGPVTVQNFGDASFLARKLITVDARGVQAWPAVVEASSQTHLVGMSTDYDRLPIVGSIVRSQARSEYQSRQGQARWETEQKISRRVGHTLDQQTGPWLAQVERQFQEQVLDRADALGLGVLPVEVRTTEDRLIARLRVASDQQLASHSPRNRAPSDSVLSVQLHESLLNNALAGLELGGHTMTPEQLTERLREKLSLAEMPGQRVTEKVQFILSEADPVRVAIADGRMELVLSFAALRVDGGTHRNFRVHAFYVPVASGITARFERQGPAQIEGQLRTASRLRLHAIFGKALPEEGSIEVLRRPPSDDHRLDGLMVTQFVLDDGWLGLALGPEGAVRTARTGRYVR
ncbi:hypothetical protein Pla175_50750 [Pirellulimonas nuda]|uniref:Uncharacterized protein n=1 Tax=Pirellulimonas nuda TaxID=2528009 RepID=A0A518DJJ7_9BACT|nr:hypothetical protein [Pirellulimonas nuda]QDU91645.1 hypothetical protein Pla175_50750 [Pirellulimonas nuda]